MASLGRAISAAFAERDALRAQAVRMIRRSEKFERYMKAAQSLKFLVQAVRIGAKLSDEGKSVILKIDRPTMDSMMELADLIPDPDPTL